MPNIPGPCPRHTVQGEVNPCDQPQESFDREMAQDAGLRGAEAVLKLRSLRASADLDAYWAFHENVEHVRNPTSTSTPLRRRPPPCCGRSLAVPLSGSSGSGFHFAEKSRTLLKWGSSLIARCPCTG